MKKIQFEVKFWDNLGKIFQKLIREGVCIRHLRIHGQILYKKKERKSGESNAYLYTASIVRKWSYMVEISS